MRRTLTALFTLLALALAAPRAHAVAPTPGTTIRNQASGQFIDAAGLTEFQQSPTVTAYIQPAAPSTINFFTSDAFATPAPATGVGRPLFIQAAVGCKTSSVHITLVSKLTGDTETFTATETTPGSGLYRILPNVPTRDGKQFPATSGNGILETLPNDIVTASLTDCGATTVTTAILIDPNGFVFNTANNQPLAGITVTLIDVAGNANGGRPNQPARVLQYDGVTAAPATFVTGADGHFSFPLVGASTYRYQVTAPSLYRFPSQIAVAAQPPGRLINAQASYGGTFTVAGPLGPVQFDIPLDPGSSATVLFVEKTANLAAAEIGDIVTYSVKLKNNASNLVSAVTLTDDLPAGFTYLKKSARLDDVPLADPPSVGPHLEFSIASLAANATVTLTYRVRIGPGAVQGNGINHAQARAPGPPPLFSNIGTARVKLSSGVFDDKGIIFGKIFIDQNHNSIQDDGEPGIPGVRIYLEDGTYAITDGEGKYSIYGLDPRTHVLKIDETTLPPGWQFEQLSPRHNARGTLCLVDLHRHEFRKVNFADISDSPKVLEQVKKRRAKGNPDVAEVQKSIELAKQITVEDNPLRTSDVKAQPASGIVGALGPSLNQSSTPAAPSTTTLAAQSPATSSFTPLLPDHTLNSRNSNLPPAPSAAVPRPNLEKAVADLTDNTLGFMNLADGDTLPMAQTSVWVKGPLGTKFVLKLHGEPLSESFVGKRARLAEKQIEAWEFVGVSLTAGPNTLELTALDPFGNDRGTKKITVIAPGKLGRLKLTLPTRDQPADGVTPAKIKIEVLDDKGVPVTARTPVTLEATCGRWDVKDLDPNEPGVQTFITGGQAELVLLPPGEPNVAKIVVSSGILKDEGSLAFLPDLRPMIAAGVVETRVNFHNVNMAALRPARGDDGFETELRNWSWNADNGKLTGATHGAVFLKGKIAGDYLLTLAYDSDKSTQERLFRDIQPDAFYPVYGDSCVRGFDAQSTSKLYVRIDKKRCYLLCGDYTTQSDTEARGLGNYSRSLTGIKEHYETSRVKANVWASYDTSTQVIQEFRADGTSGPYFFNNSNALENSEKVEILVRDRYQPSVILKTTLLQRFDDYEFEPFAGRLLFKMPIPSLDENLNLISIRVTYETDQGGKKFLVTGADAQVKLTKWWEVGGATVQDFNPDKRYELNSLNTTFRVTQTTHLIAEVAQSHSETNGTGNAGRVELRHNTDLTDLRLFAAHVETNFDNTASMISAGRQEIGGKLSQKITLNDRLLAEAVATKDLTTNGERRGVVVGWEHTFDCKLKLEIGGRHSDETVAPASTETVGGTPNHVNTARAKITTPVPFVKSANIYGEYENDVEHTDRRAAAVGGDYQLNPKTRAYARYEFLDALGSPFELNGAQQNNRTVFGIETEYLKDARLFNEYRMSDAASGRESEAATGLRNAWQLADGLRLNTTLERVNPITGTNKNNEATAGTVGADFTGNPLYKISGRIEVRATDTDTHWLNTLAYARKINDNWTMLAKSIVNYDDRSDGTAGDLFQSRFQLGTAYRPAHTDVWNALFKYEYKYEDDATDPVNNLRRQVHILTLHVNYQLLTNLNVSARYAPKFVVENDHTSQSSYLAQLVATRLMFDLTKRLSLGLNGSIFFSGAARDIQYGLGPEIGFRIHDNVWLDAGYNLVGFHDRDLSQENYTDRGLFFGMRMTFDEHLMDFAKPKADQ